MDGQEIKTAGAPRHEASSSMSSFKRWTILPPSPALLLTAIMVNMVTYLFMPLLLGVDATSGAALSATSNPYTGGDTSGCGKTHTGQLIGLPIYRGIQSSGLHRSYSVHLPPDYDKSHRYPTILGFHGSGSIGLFFEADSKLDEARFTRGKVMVYPNGLGGAWAGANYSKASVAQDLQFVWHLLTDLRQNFCIDSARIYATGLSIGGGFVDTIACNSTVGGEFAAVAPASGSFYTNNERNHHLCEPSRVPMPILEFHGGADTNVKYGGGQGEGGTEPAILDWLDWWAARNKCDAPHRREDLFAGKVHHLSWTCQGQHGAVQHYKTDGQKHDWPSTEPNFSQLAAGDKPTHIEASAIIQDFFSRFTRPEI